MPKLGRVVSVMALTPSGAAADTWPPTARCGIIINGTLFRQHTEHSSVLQGDGDRAGSERNEGRRAVSKAAEETQGDEHTARDERAVTDKRDATASPRKRADARRNQQSLVQAAADVFVTAGVEAPVRDIAATAGVGIGTIYRHFPTRADLIIAVYRHQVEACAEAGPVLLATVDSPHSALTRWIDLFVDFLVTKHGLAGMLQSDRASFESLHGYFLDRLVPVCGQLLRAAAEAGEIRSDIEAFELLFAVGNLCAGAGADKRYDARRVVGLLVAGLRAES
jgi:AcrR family transcriptional regulator